MSKTKNNKMISIAFIAIGIVLLLYIVYCNQRWGGYKGYFSIKIKDFLFFPIVPSVVCIALGIFFSKNTSNYSVKLIYQVLETIAMPAAAVLLFVNNAISYPPYWSYSLNDYCISYELTWITFALLAVVLIWLNRPILSMISSVVYLVPIIRVPFLVSSMPDNPATIGFIYICELIVSVAGVIIPLLGYMNRYQGESRKSISKDEGIQDIKSYKELLDSGIITQEEFEAKKKELLGL